MKDFSKLHFNCRLLADEMVKRKIKVQALKNSNILLCDYKGHKEIVDMTDLSVMPAPLRYLLDDKWQTKQLLEKLKLPYAKGKVFKLNELKKASTWAKSRLPVVLKPVSGCHGYGVRPNIDTIKEFEIEFTKLIKFFDAPTDILIEEQIPGEEFRLTVTSNGFFATVYRPCPKVIGNGKKSIKTLIKAENYKRMHPRKNCLCEIWLDDGEVDRYLKKKGLNLKTIPKKGEVVFLRSNSNVCTGATCIDVTELVHPFYKKLALEILHKIPGLPYAGIDIITKDIAEYKKSTKYKICEINPSPGLSLHTHPSKGKSRDLPKALIDLIYPETAI